LIPQGVMTDTESRIIDNRGFKKSFTLAQNYPNPFNPVTNITYRMERPGKVRLEILNIKGQIIKILADDYTESGFHTVQWKPENVSSGIYFYRIRVEGFTDMKKCLFIR